MRAVVAKSERDPRWIQRNRSASCAAPKKAVSKATAVNSFAKMSADDKAELDRLLSNQTTVTARIRRAFVDAVDRLANQIDIGRIRELLEQGRVSEALSAVDTQLVAQGMQPIGAASSAATVWAGQQAALALTASFAPGQAQFHFGLTNPETINYLRDHEMNLIRGLTRDALGSVRQVITDGVTAGRNPLDVARDVRGFIGLTPTQTQAVLNYRRALENLDRNALDRALRDQRFDPTVRTAIGNGAKLSPDYIDKLVERYRARYVAFRATTIARTEALRAVNAGNQQLWKQAVADGKVAADTVTRKWLFTHDSRTREAHRLVPAMNPDGVGLNEPFKTMDGPLMFPGDPNGPPQATINCRCTVFYRVNGANRPSL